MKIFKYPLKDEPAFIKMPTGAKILCVQAQRNEPTLWALVNEDNETEERCFRIAGTGQIIDCIESNSVYIGTCQVFEGNLVYHVFEIMPMQPKK